MATVRVWSERRIGKWDQCTECAYLMCLVHAGWIGFPSGVYTDAERDGLDNATPPDPVAGGSTFALLDAGSRKRYGFTLHRIPDGSMEGLRTQLRIPGQALAVAGRLSHLPAGHRLRRWQPGYTGGHALCVITIGDGKVLWLDPLAPMGFEGDTTSLDNVLTFAWLPSDARIITEGAYAVTRLRARISHLRAARSRLLLRIQELQQEPTTTAMRERIQQLQDIIDLMAADLDASE